MATEFMKLNDDDTKELRKKIGLPVTKELIYWHQVALHSWKKMNVINYEVIATYEPSGSKSLLVTLEDGKQVRILGDYLADMQKTSFLNDIGEEIENTKTIVGSCGDRIEKNIESYIVVDLETTGTNHLKDEIIEIGAIKYIAGKEVDRFNVLVKTDINISKKIEKLTGISNDKLTMYGIEPKEACIQFKSFVGNHIIIGHNFKTFDSKFLDDMYVRELNCHFPNDYIDTLYLARKQRTDLKKYTLEVLSEEYNIDYSKAHRAIEDCVINHLVYEYLTFNCLLCDESGEGYLITNTTDNTIINSNNKNVNEDELIEVTASEDWQIKISSKFEGIQSEFDLLEHSLSIMANIGKDDKVSSYAICVYEPDLVEDRRDSRRNTVLARIKEDVLKSNANIVEVYSKSFDKLDDKKRMEKDSDEFINCLIECIRKGIQNYVPKAAGFACCSRYQECSAAKKCIHTNVLYAKACQYRKNLEQGKIFY